MKNRIMKMTVKLCVLTLITLTVLGIAPANSPHQTSETSGKNLIEKLHHQLTEKFEAGKNENGLLVSAVNLTNFNIGRSFAVTMFDAECYRENEKAYHFVVVDLVELIFRMEGKIEESQLQNVLKSVVQRNSDSSTLSQEIGKIAASYYKNQSPEQKWYFRTGLTLTNLVATSFLQNQADTKNQLSELQELIKLAPESSPNQIIEQIESLIKYTEQEKYDEEDFTAIYQSAASLINLINR